MQKNKKLFFVVASICAVLVVGTICSFLIWPVTSYASDMELSGNYAFSDDFIKAAKKLTKEQWSNDYYSRITMRLGENDFMVDNVKHSVKSEPAYIGNGEVHVPIVDIAESLNYNVTIDGSTNDFVIERDGKRTSHKQRSARKNVAEEALNIKIREKGGIITITNEYQTKQLMVRSRERKLKKRYGAIKVVSDGRGFHILQYATEEATARAERMFNADKKNVVYAEPNTILSIPLDPDVFSEQSDEDVVLVGGGADQPTGSPLSDRWGSIRIGADLMKTHLTNTGKATAPILVAVIDTGIDYEHPFIAPRYRADLSWNCINNTNQVMDGHSHGTHVAGTIVDCTTDNVKIFAMKVLDDSGRGDRFDCIDGTRKAAENGAKILNLSLGGPYQGGAWEETIVYATNLGTVCCLAAGNEYDDVANHSPANSEAGITVSATLKDGASATTWSYDHIASFSNQGDAIDVAAPGHQIQSSVPGGGYSYKNGTSMAAPHVAAACAMLRLEYPSYNPVQIKQKLREMTVDCGTPGWDRLYGMGVIDFRVFFGTTVAPTSVTLSSTSLSGAYSDTTLAPIRRGGTARPTVVPSNATNKSVTFSTSNGGVASYNYDGTVSYKGVGSATLTATIHSGAFATCSVTVAPFTAPVWVDYAADSYAGGSGSALNPFKIATAEQLAKMSADTMQPFVADPFFRYYYELIDDIDLAGKEWLSLGRYEDGNYAYYGRLNGNFYSIKNMTVTQAITSLYVPSAGGLFRSYDTEVKNLALIDVNSYDAAICNTLLSGTVSNCYVTGSARRGMVGAVGSFSRGGGIVKDSYIRNDNGTATIADFAGYGGRVINSYSYGTLNYTGDASGFIYSIGNDTVSSSGNDVKITNCFSATNVQATGNKSGFLDTKFGNAEIKKCYYSDVNAIGLRSAGGSVAADLTAKPHSFFTSPATFTTSANWDSAHPWDFTDIWAIDTSGTINNGLPYLKGFYTQEQTPAAQIDYLSARITGLKKGTYIIDGTMITVSPGSTSCEIDESWFGKPVSVVRPGQVLKFASAAQTLAIAGRPVMPTLTPSHCTDSNNYDGWIYGVNTGMEYRLTPYTIWAPCYSVAIGGLIPGTWEVRVKSTNTTFASLPTAVVIYDSGHSSLDPETTPNLGIDFINERLKDLIDGAGYKINGMEIMFTGTTYAIPSGWFGTEITIVRVGDGTTTRDSSTQTLNVPARPAVSGVSKTNSSTTAGNGKISGVTTAMEYRKAGDTDWTSCSGSEISGLAAGTYEIRLKATAAAFAGAISEMVVENLVGKPLLTVTETTLIIAGVAALAGLVIGLILMGRAKKRKI